MRLLTCFTCILFEILVCAAVCEGQAPPSVAQSGPKLESCKAVAARTSVEGCWILSDTHLGTLPERPVFWTLDRYPTLESAKNAATKNGTALEVLGQFWLFTVGDKLSSTAPGTRITEIGPIPVKAGEDYTAQYRESIMQPGAVSRTHLHSGPEIFYTETGETCLETPTGKEVGRKGTNIIAPEGEPMQLMATGSEVRRGIVLVLYASAKPHTTLVTDWSSQGLCKTAH